MKKDVVIFSCCILVLFAAGMTANGGTESSTALDGAVAGRTGFGAHPVSGGQHPVVEI